MDKDNHIKEPDKLEKIDVKDMEIISKADVSERRVDRISAYRE